MAQLGRSLDVDANTNGQVVIRYSAIMNVLIWLTVGRCGDLCIRPFAGNTGSVDDNDEYSAI